MKNEHLIQIDLSKCIGCGLCQKDCPANNLVLENKKAKILTQDCIMCGHCVAICPKEAVSMTGFDESPIPIKGMIGLNPPQLLMAIRTRRSIRQFTNQLITPEIIAQIIEAGRLTPTGENAQNVSYLVLKDGVERFEQTAVHLFRRLLPLAKLVNPMAKRIIIDDHYFFKKAPVAIMILSKDPVNGALAAANMALMAEACGLGVLYSGFFTIAAKHSRTLRKQLQLNRGDKVVTTLVLGYPNVTYHRTAPKEVANVRMVQL